MNCKHDRSPETCLVCFYEKHKLTGMKCEADFINTLEVASRILSRMMVSIQEKTQNE